METETTDRFEEETLNLANSNPLPVHVNTNQLESAIDNLEKTSIPAPEDISFGQGRYMQVTDGFTPGAVKNLISISTKKLRVYAVTNCRIQFLTSSEIPQEVSELIFNSQFRQFSIVIFRKNKVALQIVSSQSEISLVILLNPATGSVKTFKKVEFLDSELKCMKFKVKRLPCFSRNSRSVLYLNAYSADFNKRYRFKKSRSRTSKRSRKSIDFRGILQARLAQKSRRWLDLTKIFKERITRERERFKEQVELERPTILKINRDLEEIKIYGARDPQNVIICNETPNRVDIMLVNPRRRKVACFRSINLLDILSGLRLKKVALGLEPDQEVTNQEEVVSGVLGKLPISLLEIFYEKETDSFAFDIKVERQEIVVKMTNIFTSETLLRSLDSFLGCGKIFLNAP